jgi:hypothetical protein
VHGLWKVLDLIGEQARLAGSTLPTEGGTMTSEAQTDRDTCDCEALDSMALVDGDRVH